MVASYALFLPCLSSHLEKNLTFSVLLQRAVALFLTTLYFYTEFVSTCHSSLHLQVPLACCSKPTGAPTAILTLCLTY